MSELSKLIEAGKRHRVSLKNRKGETLINISLLLAVILVIAAPPLLLAVLIGVVLEIIAVEYDGQELDWGGLG